MPRKLSNPAQVRGDIQRGLTGDKRNGFDPAMAPMESDDEAAGTPMTPEQIELARTDQVQGAPDQSAPEYSNAMRPPTPSANPRPQRWILQVAIAGCVIVTIVLGVLLTQVNVSGR